MRGAVPVQLVTCRPLDEPGACALYYVNNGVLLGIPPALAVPVPSAIPLSPSAVSPYTCLREKGPARRGHSFLESLGRSPRLERTDSARSESVHLETGPLSGPSCSWRTGRSRTAGKPVAAVSRRCLFCARSFPARSSLQSSASQGESRLDPARSQDGALPRAPSQHAKRICGRSLRVNGAPFLGRSA